MTHHVYHVTVYFVVVVIPSQHQSAEGPSESASQFIVTYLVAGKVVHGLWTGGIGGPSLGPSIRKRSSKRHERTRKQQMLLVHNR